MPDKTRLNDNGEAFLQKIVGARLTSVQFVLNYLILGFDERGALTTLVWPELFDGKASLQFGMPGYRDQLCELIEQVVEKLELTPDETIIIGLKNKAQMRIALRSYKTSGERAIFTTPLTACGSGNPPKNATARPASPTVL